MNAHCIHCCSKVFLFFVFFGERERDELLLLFNKDALNVKE